MSLPPLPGASKYRVSETQAQGETDIDRANAAVSTLMVLLSHGCDIPEGVERSWKFHCPFGNEHIDSGMEKNARYYGQTDTAFCFAQHGALTPVKIEAYTQGTTYAKAAESILRERGLWRVVKPYKERMTELLSEREEAPQVSTSYVVDALRTSLAQVEEYKRRQYDEDVRKKMEQCLEVLDALPDHSLETLSKWLDKAKAAMLRVILEEKAP